ncbi:Permeases of the major facilitator superfamily [Rhodococcus wratislaviensis]|uniref:Putative proline/betaine transporter n=1 Tax=Rhodococcus wratislaviensis TaxID=44752 RepID=A0A402CJY1_RHOWR|nr:MFS transporter [Rhodococcus wratislaviensis]GCE43916.1 Permeases of the major facilitator superfamily [Rhodococcus wratislaviensis]
MTSTQISVTPQAPVRPLKVAGASLIGTAIEWYDYFIYGMAAAIVFGPLFFPSFSSIAGTLAAFATFSVGFVARPIGGVVMGHFGDRIGRKSMLVLSLMLMGGATVGIGLLPTYATIGVWAPILLVTLRFVQGIGVGGEWGGAVLMAVEHAPANRKGFYGSFPQMGVPGGLILANLVFLGVSTSLSEEAFLACGWRIPFLASAVMVLMGLVIRFTITESPDFEKVKDTHRDQRLPIVTVLRENLREVLLSAGAFIGINTVGYIFMAYLLSYSTKVLGMSKTLVLVFTLVASFVWLIVIPVASMLSDRYGRRRLLVTGSVGLTVWAAALFPLIDLGNPSVMMIALLGTAVFMGIVYGPIAALFTELFSAEVRYSGASLGYQIGSVLGGGLAPTVAAALYASWGSSAPISVYLTAVTLLSLLCVVAITRKVRAAA